jgi:hypothetical protein
MLQTLNLQVKIGKWRNKNILRIVLIFNLNWNGGWNLAKRDIALNFKDAKKKKKYCSRTNLTYSSSAMSQIEQCLYEERP